MPNPPELYVEVAAGAAPAKPGIQEAIINLS